MRTRQKGRHYIARNGQGPDNQSTAWIIAALNSTVSDSYLYMLLYT